MTVYVCVCVGMCGYVCAVTMCVHATGRDVPAARADERGDGRNQGHVSAVHEASPVDVLFW